MTLSHRCLLLSCSQRKRRNPDPLPALQRYDGPLFRVLRKYLRQRNMDELPMQVWILSAEYGLIGSEAVIPYYDRRMTAKRASELRPHVLPKLKQVLNEGQYSTILINAGIAYRQALVGYEQVIPCDLEVIVSEGGHGRRQAHLHRWLYGSRQTNQCSEAERLSSGTPHIRGVQVTMTLEEIMAIARRSLQDEQGKPGAYESWYVQVDERRVAPKWLLSQITNLPVAAFHSHEANRVLQQLGVVVHRV